MKYLKLLSSVSKRTYVLLFAAIIALSAIYTYIQIEDAVALDKRIATRQKDLERTVMLKDLFLAKRRSAESVHEKKSEGKVLSLGLLEELTTKTFVAGKLSSLRPATVSEERGRPQGMFEVKVNGAALGEVISFVQELENSGFFVKKLQINMGPSGTFVDMYATITAG